MRLEFTASFYIWCPQRRLDKAQFRASDVKIKPHTAYLLKHYQIVTLYKAEDVKFTCK